MSAQKRATVRVKKAVKKVPKKTATKAASKKTVKKVTKKTAKKVAKKPATKTTSKKVVKRVVKRSKNASARPIRTTHRVDQTASQPSNSETSGRLLGRTATLSVLGLSSIPFNTDAVAVGIARIGGVAIMVCGLALSWNLYNEIALLPSGDQAAAVIESAAVAPPAPALAITSEQPVQGEVTVVATASNATAVLLTIENDTDKPYILGVANQRTEATWEHSFASDVVPNGSYQLVAYIQREDAEVATAIATPLTVHNTPSAELVATTSTSTTATTTKSDATTTPMVTEMPVLTAPEVTLIAATPSNTMRVIGTATPQQVVELLLLRNNVRATTSVQANGWWTHELKTPLTSDQYELYAQASPELLSGPLDFSVIAGRLVTQAPLETSQVTTVSGGDTERESLLWYLLAAVCTVAIGAVILLIGHHLHHTRRQPASQDTLDPVT